MSRIFLVLLAGAALTAPALADLRSRAATEAAEYVAKQFGRKAVQEGTEVLARKIEAAAVRHGDDIFAAVRRVGPKALPVVEEAGERGVLAARAIAKHGDAGVSWIASRPRALSLVAKHGDDAAAVLCKHSGGIAEPVVETFGAPAVRALSKVGPQGGRRLAMMMADGELKAIGRTPELLEVIAKYGEKACSFIWDNKGALTVGAVLTAFLANPEPFLDGVKSLASTVATEVVRPVIEETAREVVHDAAHEMAAGVAQRTNWTLIFLVVLGLVVAVAVLKGWVSLKRLAPPARVAQKKEGGSDVVE
jgi:hypothetical protein